tara:strand:- start:1155 stop:1652 length:498 start_codon:yes stop_codon:yes gene_type:complete
MRGINELAEHDGKWRSIALKITGNKMTADDLVQDMYLKLMDKDKDINDYYVTMTLKSIFIDGIRKNKTSPLFEGIDIKDETVPFEPTDEEKEILDKIKELPYRQQEFLAESYDHSLREIESIYNINYGFIYRELHKGLDAVLGDAKEQLYNNSNMKIRKAKKNKK